MSNVLPEFGGAPGPVPGGPLPPAAVGALTTGPIAPPLGSHGPGFALHNGFAPSLGWAARTGLPLLPGVANRTAAPPAAPLRPVDIPPAQFSPQTDANLAHTMSQHLASALAAVRDPELRQSLATAMATLHKYVAGVEKEHQDALAGKVSPRLLRHAYGSQVTGGQMYGPAGSAL